MAFLVLMVAAVPAIAGDIVGSTPGDKNVTTWLLKPDRVFDARSSQAHAGWVLLVRGHSIIAVGLASTVDVPKDAKVIDLAGTTLLPGLIDAHSHLFLHPYNETPWTDQVLKEDVARRLHRVARSGHRGRRLCRCVRAARHRRRIDPGTAPVRGHARHRRRALLWSGSDGLPRRP
jgi:imidazolonepropionase-like amidohydrolase